MFTPWESPAQTLLQLYDKEKVKGLSRLDNSLKVSVAAAQRARNCHLG